MIIFSVSILGYAVIFSITDPKIANWLLHGFGGGFLAFLVCFLTVNDIKISINKFQFFIVAMLMVGALGIANEILEFLLQSYTGLIFATEINDTWYDLVSNTIGSTISALCFVPFVHVCSASHE